MPQVAHPLSQRISPAGVEAERAFPWLRSLAVEQRAQFFAELFLALGQALRQHDWHIVEDLISRWQATAEVLAVPELASVLTEPLGVGEWGGWDDVIPPPPVSPHLGTSPRTPVPRRTDRT
jgi:hypothetical protein